MRKLLTLTLTLLCVAAANELSGQSLTAFKDRLARPASSDAWTGSASVRVTEYGDAAKAVAEASRNSVRSRLKGYRVCVFFDNGQDARAGAVSARALFETTFPGVRVYMVYENPYFKVTVGNCLTSEEAIILKGKVSGIFPKAFVKNEDLALSELLE